jgi:hypothetical protein
MLSKASWCVHGEATSEVEEEKANALEVGPKADEEEDAKDQAEEDLVLSP